MGLVEFSNVDWQDKKVAEFATYWNGLGREQVLPYQSEFNPAKVRHLLPGIAIYELKPNGDILCRLMGTGLSEQFGWDYTDHNFLELWAEEHHDIVRESFKTALSKPCGIFNKMHGISETGIVIKANSVGFPALDGDGNAVRLVFYSATEEPNVVREPRRDKVIKIKTQGQCFVALD